MWKMRGQGWKRSQVQFRTTLSTFFTCLQLKKTLHPHFPHNFPVTTLHCQPESEESTSAMENSLVLAPKKSDPSFHYDYRPAALTPHIRKIVEGMLLTHLSRQVNTFQDPWQFA